MDGIRAAAILAVLAYHGGTRLTSGFIGVDLFFVLSGFLITSLLLQEWHESGTISLLGFYRRRVRRLLPALLLTVALVGLIYAADAALNRGVAYPLQVLAALFYVGNWVIAIKGGGPLGLLNHIWSLAIEEQFYVLWPPILVLALHRRSSVSRVAMLLFVAAVASAALRAGLWISGARRGLYFRTDTHADGLLLGCALAAARFTPLSERLAVAARSVPLAIGAMLALLVLTTGVMARAAFEFTVGYPLVAICAAVVINHAVSRTRSPLRRALALPPVVWIGARSYGMYLFFLPVMAVVTPERLHLAFWPTFAVRVALIVAAAAVSYRFLESRFLRKTHLRGAPPHVQRSDVELDAEARDRGAREGPPSRATSA